MNTLRNLIVATSLAGLLGGCVLVIPDDEDSGHTHWHHSYDNSDASDRDTAQAVRTNLVSDSLTRTAAISVYSHDGEVTLQGTVTDAAVLGRAVALAAGTPGVKKVISELVMLKSDNDK